MVRLLNAASIVALLGCAAYAYEIKYETIFAIERLAKVRHEIERERAAIGVLRAEWAHLTRPGRLQALADKNLDLQPVALAQIVRPNELPAKAPKFDAIGRKLETLGLGSPTNTPEDSSAAATTTPAARPQPAAKVH